MNAFPANKSSEQSANEPSMEDILASIRRIIADDKMLPLTPKPSAGGEVDSLLAEDSERQHETERASAPPPVLPERSQNFEAPSLRVLQGGLPKMDSAGAPEGAEEPTIDSTADRAHRVIPKMEASFERAAQALEAELSQEPLISPNTDASVSSSFQTLAKSVFIQNTGMVEETLRTLLRPMLKQWLDQNLPPMVEKLVKTEIERVARGGR
jgi:cell pole-organizing protein PopZ